MPSNFSRRLRACAAMLSLLVIAAGAVAETKVETVQKDVVGSWIVAVDGETRTRTLNIKGAEQVQDGVWNLDCTYGWTDDSQTSVSANLIIKPDGYRLDLTTQANSRISADYSGADRFGGTFTPSSGKAKPATLERVSSEELGRRVAALRASREQAAIKQPAADVPPACAAFVGRWTGTWPGYGRTWLSVVEVGANCIARCNNRSVPTLPDSFQTCEIKGDVLSRRKPEGMEYYELHGDELWARFEPTFGPANTTVFRKLPPGGN